MENKHYWKYYRLKQKSEKLREDVERYKKYYDVVGTLLVAMARFYRNDVVNAERITHYKNALKELNSAVNAETYSWIAPVCEKVIAELERRSQAKR
jgi:hypothetical protein